MWQHLAQCLRSDGVSERLALDDGAPRAITLIAIGENAGGEDNIYQMCLKTTMLNRRSRFIMLSLEQSRNNVCLQAGLETLESSSHRARLSSILLILN